MIDLNYILLFISVGSPLVLLARLWRSRSANHRGWKIAAAIVLFGAAIALVLVPAKAGYVGGALWGLFLLLPSICERGIGRLLLERHYSRARQLAIVRQILRPWDDSVYRPAVLVALALARDGQMDAALDRLATERTETTSAGRFATALTFVLTENWTGLAAWCRRDRATMADSALRSSYLRALGETGALNELVRQIAIQRAADAEKRLTNNLAAALEFAYLLAFSGRTKPLVRLLECDLAKLPRDQQQFWIATAELAEGKTRAGLERLEKLRAETHDAILHRAIARRLAQAADFPAPQLSPLSETLLARLIGEALNRRELAARGAPAVWAFIIINVAMFGVEWLGGGSMNSDTLHNLGALEPDAVIVGHEYWRLLTALFLHYGWLHIAVNLYALYLLGPPLERLIGSTRFALSYLMSGLGSSVGVVWLHMIGQTNADQLVGASGCVMGVVGVSAGLLLLRYRQSPLAGRRLREIILIVAIQTAVDLLSPQISLAAHMSGFVTGVAIGVIFAAVPRLTTWDE